MIDNLRESMYICECCVQSRSVPIRKERFLQKGVERLTDASTIELGGMNQVGIAYIEDSGQTEAAYIKPRTKIRLNNNIGELMAIDMAVDSIFKQKKKNVSTIIFTDSEYAYKQLEINNIYQRSKMHKTTKNVTIITQIKYKLSLLKIPRFSISELIT